MACIMRMYSRIRGAGGDHVPPKRRSLWPFTWLPSPRQNRPPERCCRSHASMARTMGLRGNAIVTDVCKPMRSVAVAATVMVSMESWDNSPQVMQSKPAASAARACAGTAAGQPPTPVITFIQRPPKAMRAKATIITAMTHTTGAQ